MARIWITVEKRLVRRDHEDGTLYYRRKVPRKMIHLVGSREWFISLQTTDLLLGRVKKEMLSVVTAAQIDKARDALDSITSSVEADSGVVRPICGLDDMRQRIERIAKARTIFAASSQIEPCIANAEPVEAEALGPRTMTDAPETEGNASEPGERRKNEAPIATLSQTRPGLLQIFDKWCDRENRDPKSRNIEKIRNAVAEFIDLVGDLPVEEITVDHAEEWKMAVQRVPNFHYSTSEAKLSIREKLAIGAENPSLPRYSHLTQRNKLQHVAVVMKTARRYQKLALNPFDDVVVKDRRNHAEKRRDKRVGFTREEMVAIRDALKARKDGPERKTDAGKAEQAYWVFLLAAYHGMRREEACQLLFVDVDAITQTIAVSDDVSGFKEVKNANSIRVIPIHPALVAVGFLDYVASRANKPLLFGEDDRIEWKLAQDGRKIGTAIAKRIDKVIDKLGLREAAARQGRKITSMHSLRHSWEDLARGANIQMDVRRQLAGRQMEDDAVQAAYGSGVDLSRKREAVSKIDPFGDV